MQTPSPALTVMQARYLPGLPARRRCARPYRGVADLPGSEPIDGAVEAVVGSDAHPQAAGNVTSLIASARLHRLDPEAYLRDPIRIVLAGRAIATLSSPRATGSPLALASTPHSSSESWVPSTCRLRRRSSRPRVERIASINDSSCHRP